MKVKDIIAASQWRPSRRYGVDRPRVSVLLPTFCRGQSGLFLRSARSVLDQSLAELELIIVDDASTDGTAGQIAELMAQDERVSLLRHPRNVGLPAVSEYEAFRKARAEYLAFAFDDDEFYPSALAELLAGLQAGKHSIVHGTVDLSAYDPILRRKTKTCLGREPNGQTLLHATNYIPNNAVLLHRRVVHEVGFYDPHAAMSRLCDWDLWRRVAECFPIVPLEVRVGTVSGPATADSLGRTRLLDQWQSTEWVALPRNEQLKPGAMEEYDVLALPGGLSAGAALAAQEIGETFRDKFWFPKGDCPNFRGAPAKRVGENGTVPFDAQGQPRIAHAPCGWLADGDRAGNGHLLVVTPGHSASATLYFDHLPAPLRGRVRIAYPGTHEEEEMIGASAVVFVCSVLAMQPWIDYAERLQIPCYYFLDDNFLVLGGRASPYPELRGYTDDALRERLRGFAGVLLSSRRLIDYFREKDLHANLLYYPPIAGKPAWKEALPAPPKPAGTTRIAFFGGSHRLPAFLEQVLPAIAQLARERPVELFAAGLERDWLPPAQNLNIICFPFELSYDIALARLAACEIDLLVHPNSDTCNNEYKTLNVLISAWAMGAVPLLNDAPPYRDLAGRNVAILCDANQQSWRDAMRSCAEHPQSRESLRRNLDAFCLRHFGGQENVAVLQAILASHPAPGAMLREMRWRRAIHYFRHGFAAQWRRDLPRKVARRLLRKLRDSWPGRAVRRLGRGLHPSPRPGNPRPFCGFRSESK
jgi:hypothetical protein